MVVVVAIGGVETRAQDWARSMFDRTTNDFGTVARGAKVECRFIVENIYEEPAHIQSVSSSCGCSTPHVNRQSLSTWEKAEVLVMVDTRGFTGRKDATITVVFDQPFPAEVQLHVRAFIRGDVVVQPGALLFGSIPQGTEAKQTVVVTYAGRDDWRINRVDSENPNVQADVVEMNRSLGQVSYQLTTRVKPGAPAGYIRDQVMLVTNDLDPRAARVPVPVEGLVVPTLSARPSPLLMGPVEPGKSVTRPIVLQGRAPFQVLSVKPNDPRFRCEAPTGTKAAHLLPVIFQADGAAPSSPVTVNARIHIETDLSNGGAIDVVVSAQMLPVSKTKP